VLACGAVNLTGMLGFPCFFEVYEA
jgi:hypothetical protein